MPLRSEKGFSLLMVLAIVAIEGLIAVSILSWQDVGRSTMQKQKIRFGLDTAFEQIVYNLYQSEAWKNTASGDNCLLTGQGCVPDVAIPIVLRTSANDILVNSNIKSEGFNMKGNHCSASDGFFDDTIGNDQCPFRYVLTATPINCVAAFCDLQIFGKMDFKAVSKRFNVPMNLNRYLLNYKHGREQNSLQGSCLALGGIFDQKLLTCTPPAIQSAVCPAHQALKTLVQGQPPVCVTFFSGKFECPAGQAASGIQSDGSLTCKAVL